MANETAIVTLHFEKSRKTTDIEVPLSISANDLVLALAEAFSLHIDITNVKECYLKSEHPVALLKGNKSLAEFNVRNGTVLYISE